jgi:uncharacterized protein involved in outer membrane biogenesis
MKKGVKITGIIFLSLVLIIIAAAFVLPDMISMDTFKGMIVTEGGKFLKRDVSVGSMRLSILPTLGGKIENLAISNPPGFSQTPLLSLQSAKVRVKIIPLLFGRIEIAGITLNHPMIFIERDPQGGLNIPFMEKAGKTERKGTLESGTIKADKSKALQGLSLSHASIKDGQFIYLDRSTTPSRRAEIERFDVDLRDISLDKKIRYKLSMQWSPGEISLDGWVGPLGKTINLENIPLQGRLQADFPEVAAVMKKLAGGEEGTIAGAFKADLNFEGHKGSSFKTRGEISLKDLSVSHAVRMNGIVAFTGNLIAPAQGTPLLSLDANSEHFDVALVEKKKAEGKELTPPEKKPIGEKQGAKRSSLDAQARIMVKEGTFQGTDFHDFLLAMEMHAGEIKITRFTCAAFKGIVEGDGTFNMAQEPSPFRMQAKVIGVDADSILSSFTSAKGTVKGKLNGEVALGGAGFSADTLKKNLTGTGMVQVKEGELTWLNLIGRIVQALGGKGWGKEKTTFDDLNTSFTVKNGMVSIPNLVISQEDMALKLWGDIGLDSRLKMEGEAHLPSSATGDLSGKGWRFFADDKGRLTIPFTLQGEIKDPKVGISTRLIEQGVKGVLDQLLQNKRRK